MFIAANIDTSTIANLSGRILSTNSNLSPLRLDSLISSDPYSRTYRAYPSEPDSQSSRYAVKCLPKSILNSGVINWQRCEFNLHRRASHHPNTLTLHHVHDEYDSEFNYMVLDAPSARVLQDVMAEKVGNQTWIRSTFLQVLDIVEHLHTEGIFHRNINPASFFCDGNGHVYLAHFQMATTVGRSNERFSNTESYRSPDMIRNNVSCHKANDYWALGVFLFQLLTGITPWREANTRDPNFSIYASGDTWLLDGFGFSTQVIEIIEGLLNLDPGQRSGIQDIRGIMSRIQSFKAPTLPIRRPSSIMPSLSASSSTASLDDDDGPITPETVAVETGEDDDIPKLSASVAEFSLDGQTDEVVSTPIELIKGRLPHSFPFSAHVRIV